MDRDIFTKDFKLLDLISGLKDEEDIKKRYSSFMSLIALFDRPLNELELADLCMYAGLGDHATHCINIVAGSELVPLILESNTKVDINSESFKNGVKSKEFADGIKEAASQFLATSEFFKD